MRFLQTEWHRHERDRNAWEIERAEMKSRIGRLEGELRTSKRMQESLGKHVRLMETALKKEREKVKKLSNNESTEDIQDAKVIARDSVNYLKGEHQRSYAHIFGRLTNDCLKSNVLLLKRTKTRTQRNRQTLNPTRSPTKMSETNPEFTFQNVRKRLRIMSFLRATLSLILAIRIFQAIYMEISSSPSRTWRRHTSSNNDRRPTI